MFDTDIQHELQACELSLTCINSSVIRQHAGCENQRHMTSGELHIH